MAELGNWSVSAGGNGFAVPDGFPEGMQYSDVNNAAREIMAVLAREYKDRSGEIVSTGSSNTYSITSNRTLGSYAAGQRFTFRANFSNTGASTINVDSLGAKALCRADGSAIISGAIQSGAIYDTVYSSTLDKFILLGGFGVDTSQVASATTSVSGKVELSTNAEAIAKTSTSLVVTPSNLAAIDTAEKFTSSEYTISSGSTVSQLHGLGDDPHMFDAVLKCKTTEHGYAVGSLLKVSVNFKNDGTGNRNSSGVQVYANSTRVYAVIADDIPIAILDTSGEYAEITPANWRIVLRARK